MFPSGHEMLKEVFITPKMSSLSPWQTPATVDVNQKGTAPGSLSEPLLSTKNMKARLTFARENRDKHQQVWNSVLWTKESKIKLFGHNRRHVWCKLNTVFYSRNRSS